MRSLEEHISRRCFLFRNQFSVSVLCSIYYSFDMHSTVQFDTNTIQTLCHTAPSASAAAYRILTSVESSKDTSESRTFFDKKQRQSKWNSKAYCDLKSGRISFPHDPHTPQPLHAQLCTCHTYCSRPDLIPEPRRSPTPFPLTFHIDSRKCFYDLS